MCALLGTFTDLKLIKSIFDMNTLLCSVLAWDKQLQIDTCVLHTQRKPSYFTRPHSQLCQGVYGAS